MLILRAWLAYFTAISSQVLFNSFFNFLVFIYPRVKNGKGLQSIVASVKAKSKRASITGTIYRRSSVSVQESYVENPPDHVDNTNHDGDFIENCNEVEAQSKKQHSDIQEDAILKRPVSLMKGTFDIINTTAHTPTTLPS